MLCMMTYAMPAADIRDGPAWSCKLPTAAPLSYGGLLLDGGSSMQKACGDLQLIRMVCRSGVRQGSDTR